MSRRGGIELSVNTIVVMAIGIVIVVGGMALVWKIAGVGSDIAQRLDGEHRSAIESDFARGQLVAVAPAQASATAGKGETFGVGVMNRLDGDEIFDLTVTGRDQNGGLLSADWDVRYFQNLSVARNEQNIALVTVVPPKDAPRAEYVFSVVVTDSTGQPYGTPSFFIVRVA